MRAIKVILMVACLAGAASAASLHDGPLMCETCKEKVKIMKDHIVEEEAKWKADCMAYTDPDERGLCLAQMKRFFDHLRSRTPEQYCQDLGVCPSKAAAPSLSRQPVNKSISIIGGHSPVCEECIETMTYMKAHADDLEKQWKADCMAYTDPDERGMCLAAMKRFFAQLRSLTPEQFCQKLMVCPRDATSFRLSRQAMDPSMANVGDDQSGHSPVCDQCIETMAYMKAHADDLEKQWKADCMAYSDPDERGLCLAEMKQFFAQLRTLTPEQFCQKLKVCPKKSSLFGLAL